MTSLKNQEMSKLDNAPECTDTSAVDLDRLASALIEYRKEHEKTLNKLEMTSILALITYVAYTQKVTEETVTEVMTSHFGIKAVAVLPSRLYQDAVEYLVDLKMDKVVN